MPQPIDPNAISDAFEALGLPEFGHIFQNKSQPEEYKILQPLAKGGYGEVFLVEKRDVVYAMKKIPKSTALQNTNSMFFMYEKEIMTGIASEWLVHCHETVQDSAFLYYIMDFIPGGDLMTYIARMGKIPVNEIQFYVAEIVEAVNELHRHGWAHRDLKPDNILLDTEGHVKLGDFGTSIKLVDGKATSAFTVGTPDYVSRDLLVAVGESVTYGPEVDFWTVGVILYELFTGAPPFYSESLRVTYTKISEIDYEVPENMPENLKDLIARLLCPPEKRLDLAGIKTHPFFAGIDWNNLRSTKPPYIPKVSGKRDTANFADLEFVPDHSRVECGFKQFVGFTYDPKHAQDVANAIIKEEGKVSESPESRELKGELDAKRSELVRLKREIEAKRAEFRTVGELVMDKKDELETAKDKLAGLKQEIEEANDCIREKMAHLEKIGEEELKGERCSQVVGKIVLEDVRRIKRKLDRSQIPETLEDIKKTAYWFYKENVRLKKELLGYHRINEPDDELKKQLRIKKTEVKEYQQKLEQEMGIRMRVEEELANLKLKFQKEKSVVGKYNFRVHNAASNREHRIVIEGTRFELLGANGAAVNICTLTSLYVRELKNNEFHHFSYKKRSLCLKLFFLKEVAKSSTSGTRRSLKALEEEYNRETKILKGLNDLLSVLNGKTRQDAVLQQKGSIKKLEQMKQEIERAKKSTISEYEVGDDEKVYEFNNHLFYEKTVAKGTLCDHCNEVIYGVVNQAFCCRDCLMVVHKACYVLGDISCELNRAISAGTSLSIICQTLEDREKMLRLIKFGAI